MSATVFEYLYSSRNFRLHFVLNIPCSTTCTHIFVNIFSLPRTLSYLCLSYGHVLLSYTETGFNIVLFILILTALLLTLDPNIFSRLYKPLLPATILTLFLQLLYISIYQGT